MEQEKKSHLEIEQLKTEIKARKVETRLSIIKVVILVFGAIIALATYIFVTGPESSLNQKEKSEGIATERAILLVDKLFSIDDPRKLELTYELFRNSFEGRMDQAWISELDTLVNKKMEELYAIQDLRRQRKKLSELKAKLNSDVDAEQIRVIEDQISLIDEAIQDQQ
ncbi:MAG: hypothetical protein J5I98_30715 [Phaeodactylibacter sp.]|nr:hypothetical protein [Phaeodactylibacter sp.]